MYKVPMKVVENLERNTSKKIYFIFLYGYNWQMFGKLPNFGIFFLQKGLKRKFFVIHEYLGKNWVFLGF